MSPFLHSFLCTLFFRLTLSDLSVNIDRDYSGVGGHAPLSELYAQIHGEVLPCCGEVYQQRRLVNNRACKQNPFVIIRPKRTEDVATAVNFAHRNGIEISVRSGGHSYTCSQIKEGSILIDLRSLNQVRLIKTGQSETGVAAVLGPGATWGAVQRKIPTKHYSYPHGQCRSVGVGGYILGGGVNWLGTYNKYGYGAEQVVKMRVVTANGTVLDLSPGRTVVFPKYKHEYSTTFSPEYHNNLFFAMRGAGASMAIATEFVYTVHPTPETNPAVILAWIMNQKDLYNVQAAAWGSTKYSIAINNEFTGDFWNNLKTKVIYKFLPSVLSSLKLLHRMGDTPLFLTVTDISPHAGEFTDPVEASRYLESYGVNLIFTKPTVVRSMDNFARYLYEMNIKEQEMQPPGEYNLASFYLGGMRGTSGFQEVFFRNPSFGTKRLNNNKFRDIGCEYCFWVIHFRNRQSLPSLALPISTNTDENLVKGVDTNFVCLFKDNNPGCPREVARMKKQVEATLDLQYLSYSKYLNFPSCDSSEWQYRYWGDNYDQLLAIKSYWDPYNMFNFCQSVGSSDNSCCPYSQSNIGSSYFP